MWHVILEALAIDHPKRQWVYAQLSEPLPTGFIAISLLDSSNLFRLKGGQDRHPFDSDQGVDRLRQWLSDQDPDATSYAISAAAALPFITHPARDSLLALGYDHESPKVQLEAAWVAAKLGRESGVRWLKRLCLEIDTSSKAQRYMNELGLAHAIPQEASESEFEAKAEFSQWLAHPNELGRAPDEIQVIDHRYLNWPPQRTAIPVWLLKYLSRDQTGLYDEDIGVGMVGSVTFCLFGYKLAQRPPEDGYAIHCYWEMLAEGLVAEANVDEDSDEYDSLLRQYKLGDVCDAHILLVVELSSELDYPQSIVALARATRNGVSGWIVLDGPRSRWYPAIDMPPDAPPKTVIAVHVGRVLLGFDEEPDRSKYVSFRKQPRPPEQIIAAYERFLATAMADAREAVKLLERGILGNAFDLYVDALFKLRGGTRARHVADAYEALLAAALHTEPSFEGRLFDSHSALGNKFPRYVDALVELGRAREVVTLAERFRPQWQHNLGYAVLGSAAFKAGADDLAEQLLVQLRQSYKDWCRSQEINALAELWLRRGRDAQSHALLIEALRLLIEQSSRSNGSSRLQIESQFQSRRAAYLRLFPRNGEAELQRLGIPLSTLPPKQEPPLPPDRPPT